MKKLLYIDACVNRDISRTERLAQALLKEMNKNGEYEVETLCLEDEDLKLLPEKRVQDGNSSREPEFMRDRCLTMQSSLRPQTGSLWRLRTGILLSRRE